MSALDLEEQKGEGYCKGQERERERDRERKGEGERERVRERGEDPGIQTRFLHSASASRQAGALGHRA